MLSTHPEYVVTPDVDARSPANALALPSCCHEAKDESPCLEGDDVRSFSAGSHGHCEMGCLPLSEVRACADLPGSFGAHEGEESKLCLLALAISSSILPKMDQNL